MMKVHIQNGWRAGMVFSITTIFLILIGFNITAADLIGSILKNRSDTSAVFGLQPAMFNMLIFMAIVGLWAGAFGAKKTESDTWGGVTLASSITGLLLGAMTGVLIYLIGILNIAGVKMSTYLAQLLPDAINLYMLGRSPLSAGLFYLFFLLVSGIAGGLLARGLGRGGGRIRFSAWWSQNIQKTTNQTSVQHVLHHQITRYFFYALLLIFVFLFPLSIGQYWNYTLGTVGIYVLLGLGLNIVVGLAGLLDLGYVAFFAIGAYTVALLTAPQPHHLLWSFWVALPIGIVLASLAGILLGIPVLRMRGDYLAIVTLGFGEIIRILSKSDLLTNFSGGPKGVGSIAQPTLFGKPFSNEVDFVYIILLACLFVIFVTMRLHNSRIGRAWIAMREDETVAQAMGINTLQHKLLAFAIGAAFAGLGGVIFASRNQFTGPEDHNLMVSINVLCLVIVGGMGSIPGVIAGAFALKGLPEVLRQLENYRILAFGALLVAMMIIRPEGLIPSSRRRLEMREITPEEIVEVEQPPPKETPERREVSRI
jgi:ABC-type branched-subunit amino acid transport system permease subunit